MILEQFDNEMTALINPSQFIEKVDGMPKIAVTCFSSVTFGRLLEELHGIKIAESSVANMLIPVYRAEYSGKEFALFMSDVGAPACVAMMEDVFAMGAEKIIAFGTCGVLDSSIKDCSIIIPDRAVRDEGTSFHYYPASDEIDVNVKYKDMLCKMLDDIGISYHVGKVWTTDAIYRETAAKAAARKAMGCICVDMECSAVAALAAFRQKDILQFFYAADNLDNEEWDARSLSNHAMLPEKDRIAGLAMDIAVRIYEDSEKGS